MEPIIYFIGGIVIGAVFFRVCRSKGDFKCKIGLHRNTFYDVQSGYTRCTDCYKKLVYGRRTK